MATSADWDGDTSTGAKGFSRLWVKDGTTWDRTNGMSVNVSDSWKRVRKTWVNVSGTWKPVMWCPEINEEIYLGSITFTSRSSQPAEGKAWIKYLGGDVLDEDSWSTRAWVYQTSSFPISEGPNPMDTGWVTGMAWAWANQSTAKFKLPSPTQYDLSSALTGWGEPEGACTPVFHVRGDHNDQNGHSYWMGRICYDNTDISKPNTFVMNNANPWGYTL